MSVIFFGKSNQYCPTSSSSRDAPASSNAVYRCHKEIYQDLHIVLPLSKAKYPVYLVQSKVTKKNYVMKVFPHQNGQSSLGFKNESRFGSLQHPNIVKNLYFEVERTGDFEGVQKQISYTIMEFALHGDLLNFMKTYNNKLNEKLARTYFRQMIEGLEYLHENRVSHMDLKLENCLINADYNLKIADFDLSHFENDTIIISHGTQCYRAPELKNGKCNNTRAADVFSVGVLLFVLKTKGVFPQFEGEIIDGIDFADLMYNNIDAFWAKHSRIHRHRDIFFNQDFKDLFASMIKFKPEDRPSIKEIKASKWYNGPYYDSEELKRYIEGSVSPVSLA